MRGRKPKPTARQIAEGDPRKRGVGKLDEKLASEPKAEKGLPECPEHLRGRARGAWDDWKAELGKMNLDARPDAVMLEGACVNYARAVEADLAVEKHGLLISDVALDAEGQPTGRRRIKKNPAIEISNQAWRNVRAFCSEFGLSPVSRTRLTVDSGADDTADLMKILSQPREPRKAIVQ